VWLRMRTLFDQRSRAAACWRGAREASDSIPPSPPTSQAFVERIGNSIASARHDCRCPRIKLDS